jgi:hypothetical protein
MKHKGTFVLTDSGRTITVYREDGRWKATQVGGHIGHEEALAELLLSEPDHWNEPQMQFDPPILNIPSAQRDCPDPVRSERDLWLGIDTATAHLGLTLEDVVLTFRKNRPMAIFMFSNIGAMLVDRQHAKPGEFWAVLRDDADGRRLNAAVGSLRGWLSEIKESAAARAREA